MKKIGACHLTDIKKIFLHGRRQMTENFSRFLRRKENPHQRL